MLVGTRLFNRVEILALDILDQRDRHDLPLIEIADDGRNFMKLRALRCAPAAFACDQLVAPLSTQGTHDNRLDNATLSDRTREFVQRVVVKDLPRLIGQRFDMRDRNFRQSGPFGCRGRLSKRCIGRQCCAAFG